MRIAAARSNHMPSMPTGRSAGVLVLALVIAGSPQRGAPQPKEPAPSAELVIHAQRLLDVRSGTFVDDVAVHVRGERIHAVGTRAAIARLTLDAGFTTVRDVSNEGAGYADVALRDAIERGLVEGPRMRVATRS